MTKDSELVATMTQGQSGQSARYNVGPSARLLVCERAAGST